MRRALLVGLLPIALAACRHTVEVKAPEEPITINVNVKIELSGTIGGSVSLGVRLVWPMAQGVTTNGAVTLPGAVALNPPGTLLETSWYWPGTAASPTIG